MTPRKIPDKMFFSKRDFDYVDKNKEEIEKFHENKWFRNRILK